MWKRFHRTLSLRRTNFCVCSASVQIWTVFTWTSKHMISQHKTISLLADHTCKRFNHLLSKSMNWFHRLVSQWKNFYEKWGGTAWWSIHLIYGGGDSSTEGTRLRRRRLIYGGGDLSMEGETLLRRGRLILLMVEQKCWKLSVDLYLQYR